MTDGIRSAFPMQFQQRSALDREPGGKAGGGEAEPFTTVLGQSQPWSASANAERAGSAETGRNGSEKPKAENDQRNDTAETDMPAGDGSEGLSDATSALFGAEASRVAVATTGRSTGAGSPEAGETSPRPDRLQSMEGKSRQSYLPGWTTDASRASGRMAVQPEPGQGLRGVLLNGASANATAPAGERRSAAAAARSLLELTTGAGQSRTGEPAAALQQMLAGRGSGAERATGPAPETPHVLEAKDTEQSSRRIEGRAETTQERRLENALRALANAADGKPLEAAGGKVNLLGAQNNPAPATPSLGSTSSALVGALDADGAWKPMLSEATTIASNPARRGGEILQSIRIQLQPASLGTVTARLSVQGDQISVDLQVETTEARQRLAADSDAIVKSLRALGYEVDRVTVQQAQQPAAGSAAQNSAGRGTSFQSETGHGGASGERSQNGQGNQAGHEGERYGAPGHGQANSGRDGLYI